MVTQEQLNTEIDLAKRIYLYYFDKYATLLTVGSDKYLSWYKDLCILYFLSKGLKSIRIDDGLMYIGDTKIDENFYGRFCLGIREFITSDISDIVYAELDIYGNIKDISSPSTPPTIVTYQGFNQDWRSASIAVTVDDTLQFSLPFNISNVDEDSVSVFTSLDTTPIPFTAPEDEGIHIIGSTLYWHTYYNLKAGDIIYIQYLFNVS